MHPQRPRGGPSSRSLPSACPGAPETTEGPRGIGSEHTAANADLRFQKGPVFTTCTYLTLVVVNRRCHKTADESYS